MKNKLYKCKVGDYVEVIKCLDESMPHHANVLDGVFKVTEVGLHVEDYDIEVDASTVNGGSEGYCLLESEYEIVEKKK